MVTINTLDTKGINIGYTTIEVYPFLKGKHYNNIAKAYISSLRPSSIRAATNGTTLDFHPWRVTVWFKEDGVTIEKIEQEVKVILPEEIKNGAELQKAFDKQK